MNSENFMWQMISRSLSGEISQEEFMLLQEILKKDEQLQQQYEILKQFWHCSDSRIINNAGDDELHIADIFKKANAINSINNSLLITAKKLKRRRFGFTVAGSVAFLVLLLITLYFYTSSNAETHSTNTKLNQLVVQKGNRNQTILPDGSHVWLNAGSVLSYSNNFSGKTREVYLKGEAFFDVVKHNNQPFIVHANSVDIKVLGTAFNIKSYVDDNKVEATLIRGEIQVTRQHKTNPEPVYLHPNEKLVINLDETAVYNNKTKAEGISAEPETFTLYHLDSAIKTENLAETSWMYNRLVFRGDNFEELAKKLERWYNVKIVFKDSKVQQLSFNGSFENETVFQALADLKAAVPFDYTIDKDEISIRSIKPGLH